MSKRKRKTTSQSSAPAERLTEKERRFVEAYMGKAAGNGTEACRIAGYVGTDDALSAAASRLVRKDRVRVAIESRRAADPLVATRKQRQEFWTAAMQGKVGTTKVGMKERLRASELLGKSQADFTDRHEIVGKMEVDVAALREDIARRLAARPK